MFILFVLNTNLLPQNKINKMKNKTIIQESWYENVRQNSQRRTLLCQADGDKFFFKKKSIIVDKYELPLEQTV